MWSDTSHSLYRGTLATASLADAERPVVYVGGGARRSPGGVEAIRGLVDDLGDAVTAAVGRDGPDLMDVPIETDEPSAPGTTDHESTVELP